MNLNAFIQDFAEQFEETDILIFNKDTNFRDLEEWSSLMGLYIINMVDQKYKTALKGEELRQSKSIEDVYNIVVAKKQ
jgi:acyl carrier protein